MNSFVRSERPDLREGLAARLAAVGPLAAVYPAVSGQTACVGEGLVAHLTLEVGVPMLRFGGLWTGVVLDDGCHLTLTLAGGLIRIQSQLPAEFKRSKG